MCQVQEVASELEQEGAPELELPEAPEQEEVGRLLPGGLPSKRVRRRFIFVFIAMRDCSKMFILSSVLRVGTDDGSCGSWSWLC